ncbi:hypothetical protein HPB48_020486 [Haemaphysalis longicornis]|uniref:Uncharacterized protein n=1 Tax=Haemaphysalis longicornis TaxID=44386 RepID=A0A9J6FEA0_HAELO|nr:hypothetical protein HPB48_020486 [Haemaphysalis longicornis]
MRSEQKRYRFGNTAIPGDGPHCSNKAQQAKPCTLIFFAAEDYPMSNERGEARTKVAHATAKKKRAASYQDAPRHRTLASFVAGMILGAGWELVTIATTTAVHGKTASTSQETQRRRSSLCPPSSSALRHTSAHRVGDWRWRYPGGPCTHTQWQADPGKERSRTAATVFLERVLQSATRRHPLAARKESRPRWQCALKQRKRGGPAFGCVVSPANSLAQRPCARLNGVRHQRRRRRHRAAALASSRIPMPFAHANENGDWKRQEALRLQYRDASSFP